MNILIRSFIFDFDGILFNTEVANYLSLNVPLKEYGKNIPRDYYVGEIMGRGVLYMSQRIVKDFGIPLTPEEYLKRREEARNYLEKENPVKPIDSTVSFLKKIPRPKYKVGLASSSRKERVSKFLVQFNIGNYFNAITTEEEVTRTKPFPDCYLVTARKLNIDPSTCVALEDSDNGVASAKAAGMLCVALPTDFTKSLDFSKADLVLSSLENIEPEALIEELSKRSK